MMLYSSKHTWICVVGLLVSGMIYSACSSSQKASVPTADYAQYHTYAFGEHVVVGSKNPLFQWPQLSDRIQKALHFYLPSAGLDRDPDESPDLLIFYYVVTDADAPSPVLNYQVGWEAQPFLARGETFDKYSANTLVLDFVDTGPNELVWRGSTHLPLDDEQKVYKELSQQLKRLIRRYPLPPPQGKNS